jgi:nitronate monooxygenase
VPVVAAGGVYTGDDIARWLERGAAGVQLGTRFVATHECDADIRFKQAFLAARREDLVVIESPVGLPGRAIRNAFLDDVAAGNKRPYRCPWKCLRTCPFKQAPYCIGDALIQAKNGEMEKGFPFAGANAWRVREIVPVRTLMASLVEECRAAGRARLAVADRAGAAVLPAAEGLLPTRRS